MLFARLNFRDNADVVVPAAVNAVVPDAGVVMPDATPAGVVVPAAADAVAPDADVVVADATPAVAPDVAAPDAASGVAPDASAAPNADGGGMIDFGWSLVYFDRCTWWCHKEWDGVSDWWTLTFEWVSYSNQYRPRRRE